MDRNFRAPSSQAILNLQAISTELWKESRANLVSGFPILNRIREAMDEGIGDCASGYMYRSRHAAFEHLLQDIDVGVPPYHPRFDTARSIAYAYAGIGAAVERYASTGEFGLCRMVGKGTEVPVDLDQSLSKTDISYLAQAFLRRAQQSLGIQTMALA